MAKKTSNLKYYEGVGRRKSAVARVRLYIPGSDSAQTIFDTKIKKGEIFVNKKPIDSTFKAATDKVHYMLPFAVTGVQDRFAISIVVRGGGKKGQLEAITHGIARALEKVDESFRPLLKKSKLLSRDPRVRERRKVGTGGKARRQKQSPKR